MLYNACGGEKTLAKRKTVARRSFTGSRAGRMRAVEKKWHQGRNYYYFFVNRVHTLDRLFQERRKQSGATYGVANNVTQPKGARTVSDLDLSVFDENDWFLVFLAAWHYFGRVRLVRRGGHFGGMVCSCYDGYSEITNNRNLDFN